MRELRVVVGLMSQGTWTDDFGMSLFQMGIDFNERYEGWDAQKIIVFHKRGSLLPQMRQQILEKAISSSATHVLFLDVDQRFPHDVLRRLLSWKKQIVACNVATKSIPSSPTARYFDPSSNKGKLVYSTKEKPELEEVWRVGTGVMLIDLAAVMGVPKPWFPVIWKEEGDFQGEDWGFCQVMEKAGVKLWVDHPLSLAIEHVGPFRFSMDHVPVLEKKMVLTPEDDSLVKRSRVDLAKVSLSNGLIRG